MAIYIQNAENELHKVGSCAVIGPKGDKGDKGDRGEKGEKGDTGSNTDENAVHYTLDSGRTAAEKTQARQNIAALGAADLIAFNVQYSATIAGAEVADVDGALDTLSAALDGKQDEIEDLDDIRLGAAAGDTSIQPADLLAYYTAAQTDAAIAAAIVGAIEEEY